MPITIKPYIDANQLLVEQYSSYLPTDYQYASLHPNQIINQPDPNQLPLELSYDPWAAVAAKIQRRYPQQERPIPLLGIGGVERYQTWPERTIRSALSLPVETYQGAVQTGPGLRREDVTDIPGTAQPLDPLIERSQDIAGVAGGTMFAGVPKGAATLGSGPVKQMEKAVMTPEIKSRIVPAIKNYETGRIETVSRGKSHEELMMNYHQKSGGNPNAKYMDIVNNGLKNNETGYYDPKTKQFYNRDSVSDLESTELMSPAQLKKYEQNRVLWSSGLQFPKPIEQPSFNEQWNERVPSEMQNEERKGIQPFPTNYTPPHRFMEKRPVRLTKVDYNPFK